ncbi:MAG: hypothetical protein HY847_01130 [Betaproteobacteria bacterium]|nr:hypothetical protein [Betaproteobacteria bacterium]
MDMNESKYIAGEFGDFEEEVLNAQWLPQPELQLGLQEAVREPEPRSNPTVDVESFLRTVYLSQE